MVLKTFAPLSASRSVRVFDRGVAADSDWRRAEPVVSLPPVCSLVGASDARRAEVVLADEERALMPAWYPLTAVHHPPQPHDLIFRRGPALVDGPRAFIARSFVK